MIETRKQLLIRKRDLIATLRVLEQDCVDGLVDNAAYQAARQRYELEAAQVLERLDSLNPAGRRLALDREDPAPPSQQLESGWPVPKEEKQWVWVTTAAIAALIVMTVILFLMTAVHPRRGNEGITGDVRTRRAGAYRRAFTTTASSGASCLRTSA